MKRSILPVLLAIWLPAQAEVVDQAEQGFTIRHQLTMSTGAQQTWDALVEIGKWWDSNHSFSGSASNFSFEAKLGGCWCERLPGGAVRHQTVIYLDQPRLLRLSGAPGPMQGMGVTGNTTFAIVPRGTGSELTVSYVAGGYMAGKGGLGQLAPIVDQVYALQLARLKNLLETGKAD